MSIKNNIIQVKLFEDLQVSGLSINEIANEMNISTATVRNWIKTGYLKEKEKGIILSDSFEDFKKNIVGKEKLTLRANKSSKDEHNHFELTEMIINKIDTQNGSEIAQIYEKSLSNSYRNKEGIYYTPTEIVSDMLENIKIDENTTFLDPCCGSGNFILEAVKKGIKPQNIYGFDTDKNAVAITKKRILEATGVHSENIINGNFLEIADTLAQENREFTLIFTNPPWGKKIKKQEKEILSQKYNSGKSSDTSSLFFFACIPLLQKEGILGFLVQDALFNIATFQDTRKEILKYQILRFIDYGKAFKSLINKAQAFIIKNKTQRKTENVLCEWENEKYLRNPITFNKNPKQIFNFWITDEKSKVIDKIFSIPHITLENNAKWALGIVTGNNSKYCTDKPQNGYIPIFKGADITSEGLKNPTHYISEDFSNFQQVAPLEMYQAKEKIIYKFISSKLVFYCDTEQNYILNSANLLIPNTDIGISNKQLVKLFNSDIMNWLFQSLFNTHKILRGDLEQLPIHADFLKNNDFTELDFLNYLGIKKYQNGTYGIKK